MLRSEKLKQRAKEVTLQRDIDRKEFIADIKKKAEISRRFVNDKRHTQFKELIEFAIKYKQDQRRALGSVVETNDEYIRKGLILDTEIKTLRWILETPQKFIFKESQTKEGELK